MVQILSLEQAKEIKKWTFGESWSSLEIDFLFAIMDEKVLVYSSYSADLDERSIIREIRWFTITAKKSEPNKIRRCWYNQRLPALGLLSSNKVLYKAGEINEVGNELPYKEALEIAFEIAFSYS